ncbi:hypothetical protein ACIA8I_39320 [Streptomyces rishiriensis]|uniref:hypothetical protein n=1 Tax=Streptomyces rishiriensis TaxID=68264 RepID=UPI00379DAD2C
MAAPTFDLAVGVSSGSLDAGLEQLHAGHRGLLKGDHTEVVSDARYSVSWDLQEPPRVSLGAPDAARWKKTWKQKDVSALPPSGVVQLVMPQLWFSLASNGVTLSELSSSVAVPARLLVVDGAVQVELLGVWMGTPPTDGNDRAVLRQILVPRLLKLGSGLLKGLRLPAQDLFGRQVKLTPVFVDVTDRYLVVGTLSQPGASSVPDIGWPPDKEVFCLVSPALMTTLVGAAAQQEAKKQEAVVEARETLLGVADVTLEVHFRGIKGPTVDAQDPTRLSAGVDLSWKGAVTLFASDTDEGCALVEATQNM